jgi:alkanesulfonate monooxygenase SsuD/methylene tetrahydromethanopterin reductase-like flavin-dependent oxidoreductase (luciferase family)
MPAPVRFGFGFDMRNPAEWPRPWPGFYEEHVEFIAWTESLGFGGVWLAEHHGIDDGYLPSPLMVGAAVAARTKKMRISTGVALAPHYHPVRLAEDMVVLDHLSNGRAEISLGLGYLASEAEAYGFDRKKRGQMANELLQIVRRLWEGETVTFEGECYSIKNARVTPRPIQQPSIPLFVGAAAGPGIRRAAVYGDGLIGGAIQYEDYLNELRALGKPDSAARRIGMDDMWCFISEDPEKSFDEIAPHAYYQIHTYAKWAAGRTGLTEFVGIFGDS